MKGVATILLFGFLFAGCGGARELGVEDAWARPGLAGNNSAVYFVIDNPTGEADTLLRAATDAAAAVEMHRTMAVEGENHADHDMGHDVPQGEVLRMVRQENVPIPSGEKVSFQPGGLHVMLIDLNTDLVKGQTIEVTLTFEKAGEITLQVPVEER